MSWFFPVGLIEIHAILCAHASRCTTAIFRHSVSLESSAEIADLKVTGGYFVLGVSNKLALVTWLRTWTVRVPPHSNPMGQPGLLFTQPLGCHTRSLGFKSGFSTHRQQPRPVSRPFAPHALATSRTRESARQSTVQCAASKPLLQYIGVTLVTGVLQRL